MRSGRPIWGLVLLLAVSCVAQAARLTHGGMPAVEAGTTVITVVAAVAGLTLVPLVLLGARNRRLLALIPVDDGDGDTVFAIFLPRELRDALGPFSSSMDRLWNKHGVMQVGDAGVAIWSAQKHGPAIPELVATIPRDRIVGVSESFIPIDGGDFWGLSLETRTPDGDGRVLLPIGLADKRLGAFFTSRREVASSHALILALISPAASHT